MTHHCVGITRFLAWLSWNEIPYNVFLFVHRFLSQELEQISANWKRQIYTQQRHL